MFSENAEGNGVHGVGNLEYPEQSVHLMQESRWTFYEAENGEGIERIRQAVT